MTRQAGAGSTVALAALMALVAVKGCTAGASGGGMKEQIERPVILVECPALVQDADMLCRALIQAMSESAPGHVIRRVPRIETRPSRPDDLAVALHVHSISAVGIEGQLTWQTAQEGPQSGPRMAMTMMDAPPTPAMMAQFVAALLRDTDLPLNRP